LGTSPFLKRSFAAKKLDMALEKIFGFFLEGCLSSSFKGQLTFSNVYKTLQ
jgi:hypothetical protein